MLICLHIPIQAVHVGHAAAAAAAADDDDDGNGDGDGDNGDALAQKPLRAYDAGGRPWQPSGSGCRCWLHASCHR